MTLQITGVTHEGLSGHEILLHMSDSGGGGGAEEPRPDKRGGGGHAYHNGLFDMLPFTRGQEFMGEKRRRRRHQEQAEG